MVYLFFENAMTVYSFVWHRGPGKLSLSETAKGGEVCSIGLSSREGGDSQKHGCCSVMS